MSYSFELKQSVAFHDLDPLRIVWHGNYFKYFDQTRFALFNAAGVDLYRYMTEKQYAFPLSRTNTKYIIPLVAGDEFVCKATVTEARYKIVMEFEIRKVPSGELCARATSEQLAVKFPDMELEFEIPEDIQQALGFL